MIEDKGLSVLVNRRMNRGAWMAGTSQDKPGHDGGGRSINSYR
jgi:hypothetical protein